MKNNLSTRVSVSFYRLQIILLTHDTFGITAAMKMFYDVIDPGTGSFFENNRVRYFGCIMRTFRFYFLCIFHRKNHSFPCTNLCYFCFLL